MSEALRQGYHDVQAGPEPGTWSVRWTVPATLAVLDGHFPGDPILPAFAIMAVSHAAVEVVTGRPVQGSLRARQCKFKAPVRPHETYCLRITTDAAATWSVAWHGPSDVVAELQLSAT